MYKGYLVPILTRLKTFLPSSKFEANWSTVSWVMIGHPNKQTQKQTYRDHYSINNLILINNNIILQYLLWNNNHKISQILLFPKCGLQTLCFQRTVGLNYIVQNETFSWFSSKNRSLSKILYFSGIFKRKNMEDHNFKLWQV